MPATQLSTRAWTAARAVCSSVCRTSCHAPGLLLVAALTATGVLCSPQHGVSPVQGPRPKGAQQHSHLLVELEAGAGCAAQARRPQAPLPDLEAGGLRVPIQRAQAVPQGLGAGGGAGRVLHLGRGLQAAHRQIRASCQSPQTPGPSIIHPSSSRRVRACSSPAAAAAAKPSAMRLP